jgi:hypothetical protein
MIKKISTTIIRDLLVPTSLISSKKILKVSYKMPIVEAVYAKFSTNTPKLKQNN